MRFRPFIDPYQEQPACDKKPPDLNVDENVIRFDRQLLSKIQRAKTVIRLPAYEAVIDDPILYAHASRVMHGETNPGNARPLIQQHGTRQIWVNPPPIPLTMKEMDGRIRFALFARPAQGLWQCKRSQRLK